MPTIDYLTDIAILTLKLENAKHDLALANAFCEAAEKLCNIPTYNRNDLKDALARWRAAAWKEKK